MRDGELLLCRRDGKQEGRKGWMKQWKQLWSSLQEAAPKSAAKPAEQHAWMWCSSSWASRLLTNTCVTCESVSVRERCGVAPFGEELILSPFTLPSCLLSCCKLNALRRCCRLCLSHPFIRSLCPFPLTQRAYGLHPPPPLLLPSPVIILLHHRRRFKCRAATLYCCVPCATHGGGFLQACLRWSSQIETPSILLCKPHLLLLPSTHHALWPLFLPSCR